LRREKYNHNTDIFTFALPNPAAQLDLPVSSFFLTKTKGADGKDIIRQCRQSCVRSDARQRTQASIEL